MSQVKFSKFAGIFFGLLAFARIACSADLDTVLARTDGDLLVRWHFIGMNRVVYSPDNQAISAIGKLKESVELRESVFNKLATAPFRIVQHKTFQRNTNDFQNLIRPLIDDLWFNETCAEFRGPTNSVPEFLLAVRLNDTRAAAWQSSLATVISAWTGIAVTPVKGDDFSGWELRKHHDPNAVRCLRSGEWVLFGWGWNDIQLQSAFLKRIKLRQLPVDQTSSDWLDLLVDWPNLNAARWLSWPDALPKDLPKMHLTARGQKDFIRPKLVMQFASTLNLRLDAWQIPTNSIHSNISSFAAMRGTAGWLGKLPWFNFLHVTEMPNQYCTWSQAGVPLATYMAVPEKNAQTFMKQNGPGLAADLNARAAGHPNAPKVTYADYQVTIAGMPMLSPFIRPLRDGSGDYVMAGIFPFINPPHALPIPPPLIAELNSKKNLFYYSWEVNQDRILQALAIQQMRAIVMNEQFPPASGAAGRWISAVREKLGNCATEGTVTGPNELTFIRNAPLFFTGFEIAALDKWLDAPDFPFSAAYGKPVGNPPVTRRLPPRH